MEEVEQITSLEPEILLPPPSHLFCRSKSTILL